MGSEEWNARVFFKHHFYRSSFSSISYNCPISLSLSFSFFHILFSFLFNLNLYQKISLCIYLSSYLYPHIILSYIKYLPIHLSIHLYIYLSILNSNKGFSHFLILSACDGAGAEPRQPQPQNPHRRVHADLQRGRGQSETQKFILS